MNVSMPNDIFRYGPKGVGRRIITNFNTKHNSNDTE